MTFHAFVVCFDQDWFWTAWPCGERNFHDMNSMHPTDHQPLRTWPFCFFFKFCSEWQENNLNYLWPSVAAQPWGAITSREIGTTAPCRKGLLSWAWEHDAICIAPNPCNEMQWQDCAAHACVCMCMHVYATSCQSHNSQTLSNICLSPVDTVKPKLWWFCLWGFHLFWQP